MQCDESKLQRHLVFKECRQFFLGGGGGPGNRKKRKGQKKQRAQQHRQNNSDGVTSASGHANANAGTNTDSRASSKAPSHVVISLSGGVDSMVIAKCLTALYPPPSSTDAEASATRIVAVHIDYGNRAESGLEAAFLEAWCVHSIHTSKSLTLFAHSAWFVLLLTQ